MKTYAPSTLAQAQKSLTVARAIRESWMSLYIAIGDKLTIAEGQKSPAVDEWRLGELRAAFEKASQQLACARAAEERSAIAYSHLFQGV